MNRIHADYSRRCEQRDRAARIADRIAHSVVLAIVLLALWRFVP